MRNIPAEAAELARLPEGERVGPLVRFYHDLWRNHLNGMELCLVGVLCERVWNPTDPDDPVLNAAEPLVEAGGLPRLLHLEGGPVEKQMDGVQGLLLPGGYDMHPGLYGQQPAGTNMGEVDLLYDRFEMGCINLALERELPILGICRGAQMLNVARGGTLHQQIPHEEKHQEHDHPESPTHPLEIVTGTSIEEAMGDEQSVNSKHTQATARVGEGLVVTALGPDGVIEAIESVDKPWQMGVEFHPEVLRHTNGSMMKLFQRLVDEARQY